MAGFLICSGAARPPARPPLQQMTYARQLEDYEEAVMAKRLQVRALFWMKCLQPPHPPNP
jgi:hypothetical protein